MGSIPMVCRHSLTRRKPLTRVEAASRVKHDLGKYVALNQRWRDPQPSEAGFREAVLTDLLSTRRSGADIRDVQSVWDALRPEREALSSSTNWVEIEIRMVEICALLPVLRANPSVAFVARAGQLALEVSDLCRCLV